MSALRALIAALAVAAALLVAPAPAMAGGKGEPQRCAHAHVVKGKWDCPRPIVTPIPRRTDSPIVTPIPRRY